MGSLVDRTIAVTETPASLRRRTSHPPRNPVAPVTNADRNFTGVRLSAIFYFAGPLYERLAIGLERDVRFYRIVNFHADSKGRIQSGKTVASKNICTVSDHGIAGKLFRRAGAPRRPQRLYAALLILGSKIEIGIERIAIGD